MSKREKRLKSLDRLLNTYTIIGVVLIVIATILLVTPALPYIWYRLNGGATEDEIAQITQALEEQPDTPEPPDTPPEEPELPPIDRSLPSTNMIIISSIGVNSEIQEGENGSAALENGIWRVPNFGTPEDTISVILAGHRFGYIYWSSDFRTKSSFFNLPKTGVGDEVTLIWGQREYTYEIYEAKDGTYIDDYDADLILYTCRLFNSPVRVFRYAKRV